MAKMTLGAYTFIRNPSQMTLITKDKSSATLETYESVSFFSWGVSYIGKVLSLDWGYMSTSQYESLKTMFEAEAQVVFDPQDGSAKTFNVEIPNLNGEYHVNLANAAGNYRKNVNMKLLIMSEV